MKRYLPWLAFVIISILGISGAAFAWLLGERTERYRFEALAEEAARRVDERVSRHMLVIEATAAMFEAASGGDTAERFQRYVRNLRMPERNPGSVGLGYSILAEPGDRGALARAYEANRGAPLEIWPDPGASDAVVVAVLFENVDDFDAGPQLTSGFNAFSDPTRRAAIDRATTDRAPRAAGPVTLVSNAAPPLLSFVIYAPVYGPNFGVSHEGEDRPSGFVVAAFHAAELIDSALRVVPELPLSIIVTDAAAPETPLHVFGDPASHRFGAAFVSRRSVSVAGHVWDMEIRPTAALQTSSIAPLALSLAFGALLLAAAVAAMLREQARARAAAEALAATTQRGLSEKDLLLQEMKHRIKNAIARILAIARQTAVRADTMEEFLHTFTERLRALSNAQDMLTRSRWQRADLGDLLREELAQVFGPDFDLGAVEGPVVRLDERVTQGLGLTFHELSTNALKHGGNSDAPPAIAVTWRIEARDGRTWLHIDWRERGDGEAPGGAVPGEAGFGTKLIDTTIRNELGGSIERDHAPEGFVARLSVPLA